MQRRDLQRLLVLTGILLALWAGRPQPAAGQKASGSGKTPAGPRAVIPADLYVDDDNAGAQDGSALRPYRTVQQAINAAKGNAVIAVAGGTYPENIRVRDKAVRLYGGYVGGTRASYASRKAGNFTARDPAANTSHLKGNGKDSVVTMQEPGASVVDGFLVTGGGRSSAAAPSWLGGGFYIVGGSPTISNNVIEKNQTCPPVKQDQEKYGGGIYFTGAGISILDNVIRNNVSGRGAGIAVDGRKVVIRGNTVQNNVGVSDHGGGLHIFSQNAEISYNRIVGNEIGRGLGYGWGGGAIVFNKGGNYKLSHNIFTGNFAPSVGSAVFVDDGAVASMDHDLVYANACKPAGDGVVAPVYVDGDGKVGSALDVNHVTIADHTCKPPGAGAAIRVTDRSRVTVKNSILWNNGGNDISVDKTSKAAVSYTLTQKATKGAGNLTKDPLFANAARHDYRLRSTGGRWDQAANGKKGGWARDSQHSPAIDAADPAAPFKHEPAPNGGRANLGAYGNTAQASKAGTAGGVKETGPAEKTPKAYLLRGTAGELPSETGDDKTKMSKIESKELGGPALEIQLLDTFGQSKARVTDWTGFTALRLDIVNKSEKELSVGLNLFHSGTKGFATRVVAPFTLKPGKNEVRIAVKGLKNTNGSAPNLAEVKRWYVASEAPVTLHVGDIWLEGTGKSGASAYRIKSDPARWKRLKSARLPDITRPVVFNTPEADDIMSAVELFPHNNPWNTLIEDWPVHPRSKKLVASVGADKPLRYNRDMSFVIVPPGQKKIDMKIIQYPKESDTGPYPVPDNTPIEGWPAAFKNDPKLKKLTLDDVQRGKPSLDEDRHGIVFDPVNRKVYEFYRLTKTDKGWHADQASIFDLSSNKLRPAGWTSSDAAGLPILPAIVRHDEIKRGVIDHALRFTIKRSRRAYVYPATHYASTLRGYLQTRLLR